MNWLARTWAWIWGYVSKLPGHIWGVLWGKETPLIITVGLAVLAAFLSPMITEKYERQRMRSEYVLANLRELNGLISVVYVNVTAINFAVAGGGAAPPENVTGAREALAQLNWKVVETAAMLPTGQRDDLQRFQRDVVAVSEALNGELDIARCRILLDRVDAMALSAALTIQAVGRHADLAEPAVVVSGGSSTSGASPSA